MNTEIIKEASQLLSSLVPQDNKFSAANVEYDRNNINYIKSYKFTVTTASILAELCLSTITPSGNNKSFVLSGPYGTGKSHLLLQYISLISGDFPDITKEITLQLKKLPVSREISALLKRLENNSLPRLLPVIVKSGLSTLRSTFALSLLDSLETHGLSDLMPQIYGDEAISVIERWKTNFPTTFNAFVSGLETGDTVDNYIARLHQLDDKTCHNFSIRYSELTSGSIFTPRNNAEPKALYLSVMNLLKNTPYNGIALIFDEFSKYLETGAANAKQSETKLLQDLAEYASRTETGSGPIMNFVLVTHKDISGYINHLPKNIIDGWRGVAERFTALHMPQNLEQTSLLLSEATGSDNCTIQTWLKNNSEIIEYECKSIDSTLRNVLTPEFARRIFPLHILTAYALIRLSENIGQNERSVYAFMSNDGPLSYREGLKHNISSNRLLLTPDIAFDYFEERIREQIYDQDFTFIYEIYQKAFFAIHELGLKDLDEDIAIRIIKTLTICEFLNLDILTKDKLLIIFTNSSYDASNALNSLINANIVSEYIVTSTIRLNRPDTTSADILIKKTVNELENRGITNTELCRLVLTKDLIFYPDLYNDETRIIRYFRSEFTDYTSIKDKQFSFINDKQKYLGTDGFIYFIFGIEDSESLVEFIKNISSDNSFINLFIPVSMGTITPTIRRLLLTLRAIHIIRTGEKAIDIAISNILHIIEEDTKLKLSNVKNIFTCQTPENQTIFASFTCLNSVRTFRYKSRNSTEFSDILSDLCAEAFYSYPEFRNEMTVCTNPSGVTRGAVREIIRALFKKPGGRFKNFKPYSQHMTIIRSILERPQIIHILEDQNDFELLTGNEKTEPLLKFIREWFIEATREQSLNELVKSLTSVNNGFGIRLGIIPLLIACAILPFTSSIYIINRKQKNLEMSFSADLFISMFDNQESIDVYKIRFRKIDIFHTTICKCIYNVFHSKNSSFEIPTLEKTAEALNNWFLLLPKFCRKTAFSQELIDGKTMFSILNEAYQTQKGYELTIEGLSENAVCNFVRKIAAYAMVTPRQRYFDELPTILNFNRNTNSSEILSKLNVVKSFAENALNLLYDDMSFIVTKYWKSNGRDLKSIVKSYASNLKCNHVSNRILFKNDVQYILKEISKDNFTDRDFLLGLALEITKLNPKEWDANKYIIFRNEVIFLGSKYQQEINSHESFNGDLSELPVDSLISILEEYSTDTSINKDYIYRDLKALFQNYNLCDRDIVLTLLKVITEKLHN